MDIIEYSGQEQGEWRIRMNTSTAIGAKVKSLRIGKEMTIKQLSEACGLSVGFLSQFERGISSIAIDSLETIANVLEGPLSELFMEMENEIRIEEPEDPIMHGMELIPSKASTQMYQYILKHPHTDYALLPRLYTLLPPSEDEEILEMYSHKGEEFLFVLEGTITLYLEDRKYVMYPGDSIHFNSSKRHNWTNKTTRIARILTVNSPNPLKKKEESEET